MHIEIEYGLCYNYQIIATEIRRVYLAENGGKWVILCMNTAVID